MKPGIRRDFMGRYRGTTLGFVGRNTGGTTLLCCAAKALSKLHNRQWQMAAPTD